MVQQRLVRLSMYGLKLLIRYKGSDVHCGKCGTCVERKEAFADAGVNDPTVYEE